MLPFLLQNPICMPLSLTFSVSFYVAYFDGGGCGGGNGDGGENENDRAYPAGGTITAQGPMLRRCWKGPQKSLSVARASRR